MSKIYKPKNKPETYAGYGLGLFALFATGMLIIENNIWYGSLFFAGTVALIIYWTRNGKCQIVVGETAVKFQGVGNKKTNSIEWNNIKSAGKEFQVQLKAGKHSMLSNSYWEYYFIDVNGVDFRFFDNFGSELELELRNILEKHKIEFEIKNGEQSRAA
jgi:hypothetical protein